MNFKILTLGCKTNQYESQLMREQLTASGFTLCEPGQQADICIINSCTVTAESDKKNRQTLRRAKKDNPDAVIILTGCMTQAAPGSADNLPADIVIGNSNRELIPELISGFLTHHHRIIRIEPHSDTYTESHHIASFFERSRAMIKIEDGCNNFCSYCIIPYARGRVRSRPLDAIIREIDALPSTYCEVVLTGINLSCYGQDIGLTLYDAVHAIAESEKIKRIRLGSAEPDLMDDEMLRQLACEPKFCPHFHLSLQSGCDATLRRMNRHYDTDYYRNVVRRIREYFENPSITTDIMVGFPGETNEEFETSLSFAKEIGFARTHVFAYSRRPGTPADTMDGQIPNAEKERRSDLMLAAAGQSSADFRASQVGRICTFLPERELSDGIYEGYSENYTPLHVHLCEKTFLPVRVMITSAEDSYCIAKIIQ